MGARAGLRTALAVTSALLVLMTGVTRGGAAVTLVSSDGFTGGGAYHATEVEPDTFVNNSTMVSAFQVGRYYDGGASDVGYAVSTDGTTWASGTLPDTTAGGGSYARATDASVAYDAAHNTWLIVSLALTSSRGGIRGAAVLANHSSTPATAGSWTVTAVARAAKNQDFDKTWVVCDNTSASPYYGRCYVQWDDHGNGNHLMMSYSTDGGGSWISSRVPRSGVIGGQPVVQPGGKVIVPLDNAYESAVGAVVSTNGGASFSSPYTIASISSHTEAGNLRSGPLPSAEISSDGTVYVVWQDCRFETQCAANDIVVSSSGDGINWTAPSKTGASNPAGAATLSDYFLPGLAVNPSATNELALTYYYYPTANCGSSCQLDVGFTSSGDGGSTWTARATLAGPMNLASLPLTNQGYMVGDYMSTSFVSQWTASGGPAATSVFAVGDTVTTCSTPTSTSSSTCALPMESPGPITTATAPVAGAAILTTNSGTNLVPGSAPTFSPYFEPSDSAPGVLNR